MVSENKADIQMARSNVCFRGQSGHGSGYDILRFNEAAIVRLWLMEKAKNPK
jgi:hypothetical protein